MKKIRRPELVFLDALNAFLSAEAHTLLTDVSERNTCGRLAIYLEQQIQTENLAGYYADPEYNRKQNSKVKTIVNNQARVVNITADLIVHSRGEKPPKEDNLIAVEVKKSTRPEGDKLEDKERLQAMTREPYDGVWPVDGTYPEHVCGYAVGVYVEIDIDQRRLHLEFYKKGALTKQREQNF